VRIAWVGGGLLGPHLAGHGVQVKHLGFTRPRLVDFKEIEDHCGFTPDAVVFEDNSCPPPFTDPARFPCLTVFYSVDSHIQSWHPLYAQAFDLCAVSLKDHMPRFEKPRLGPGRLIWSPPFARAGDRPLDLQKDLGAVFVGKDDPEVTPARSALLAQLRALVPDFRTFTGAYQEIYSRAGLVFNVSERGDLNYRTFEALGCGACLLTPKVGHGFGELFTDGQDLFTYPVDMDARGIADIMKRLLADPDARARVAASGLARIDAGHRPAHRAAAFARWISSQPAEEFVRGRLKQAKDIHARILRPLFLHFSQALMGTPFAAAYLAAAKDQGGNKGGNKGGDKGKGA